MIIYDLLTLIVVQRDNSACSTDYLQCLSSSLLSQNSLDKLVSEVLAGVTDEVLARVREGSSNGRAKMDLTTNLIDVDVGKAIRMSFSPSCSTASMHYLAKSGT